ncbi:MAG: universal stress protein [Pseudomonadota bacterium]
MTSVVLCAVDITRPDEDAHVLQAAKRLADMDGAQLDVITVVPDFGATIVGAYFQDHDVETAKDGATKALNNFCVKALGESDNAKLRHIVAVGTAYEEVLKTAKISNADLIVIGAHKPDFKDYLLGPNAARVVRHSNCSVYVVR